MTAIRRSCDTNHERTTLIHKPLLPFSSSCCDNSICSAVVGFFRKHLCFQSADNIIDGNRYVRRGVVGRGANAVVYKAYDCDEKKIVVIKQGLSTTDADVAKQQKEQATQAYLANKITNIPKVTDFYVKPGNVACTVMEYIDCPNVFEQYVRYTKKRKLMPIKDIAKFTRQLINTVVGMAKKGLVTA